jgi:hypothetical protein
MSEGFPVPPPPKRVVLGPEMPVGGSKSGLGPFARLLAAFVLAGLILGGYAFGHFSVAPGGSQAPLSPVQEVIQGLTRDAGKNCIVFTTSQEFSTRTAAEANAIQIGMHADAFQMPTGARLVEHKETVIKNTTVTGTTAYLTFGAAEVCVTPQPATGGMGS